MRVISVEVLFLGSGFFVFGAVNVLISRLKLTRSDKSSEWGPAAKTAARIAEDYSAALAKLAVPMLIGGALVGLVGGIGLLATR